MASKQIETKLNEARQQLADLQAIANTSDDTIVSLKSTLSESLAGIPLNALDEAARRQAETRLKLEAENLKLAELERRVQVAQEKVVRLNSEWREARGRELAAEAYKESDSLMTELEALNSKIKAHYSRYDEINRYYPAYSQPFSGSFVNSVKHTLEVYQNEARQRVIN